MAIIVGFPGNNPLLQGTTLDDEIFGNSLGTVTFTAGNDRIFGLAGDDVIAGDGRDIAPNGRGGHDLIQGGDGDDDLYGDARVTLYGVGGNDTLYQNGGSGEMVGDAGEIAAGGRGGNDRLYGEVLLIGDAYDSMVSATGGRDLLDATGATDGTSLAGDSYINLEGSSRGGNDTLLGSGFDDILAGDADDYLENAARGGNDRLNGNGGDDLIYADGEEMYDSSTGGDDVLRGGSGDDEMYGDAKFLHDFAVAGNDRLFAGSGNDEIWGDGELVGPDATGGQDKFFFSGNFGDDSIFDFRQEDGDQIVLQGLTQLDVQLSIITVTDPNDSTLITTLGDDSITLVGFTGGLTPGVDIVFA